MENTGEIPKIQRLYSDEVRELISSNPGLLKQTLFLIDDLRGVDTLNERRMSEDGRESVTFLGNHYKAQRRYYKVNFLGDSGVTHNIFLKEIGLFSHDSEDGVKEFRESHALESLLQQQDHKIRVAKGIFGINMHNKSYFASEYEEGMIQGSELNDLLKTDGVLLERIKDLVSFLGRNGYSDIQYGYKTETDEIVIFDVTN